MTSAEDSYLLSAPAEQLQTLLVAQQPTAVVRAAEQPMDQLPQLFDTAFRAIFPALAEQGLTPAGPAFALYHRAPDATVDIEVGVPVATALEKRIECADGLRILPSWLPDGRIARLSHVGGYDQLGASWSALAEAIEQAGLESQLPFWEVYVTEPTPEGDPEQVRTDLYTRVR